MATLPSRLPKVLKSTSEDYQSFAKPKSPRLSIRRFLEKSKLKRGFVSSFDIPQELHELECPERENVGDALNYDVSVDENNKKIDENHNEVFVSPKPRLRRRHSFSTVASMAKVLIEKVCFLNAT